MEIHVSKLLALFERLLHLPSSLLGASGAASGSPEYIIETYFVQSLRMFWRKCDPENPPEVEKMPERADGKRSALPRVSLSSLRHKAGMDAGWRRHSESE